MYIQEILNLTNKTQKKKKLIERQRIIKSITGNSNIKSVYLHYFANAYSTADNEYTSMSVCLSES